MGGSRVVTQRQDDNTLGRGGHFTWFPSLPSLHLPPLLQSDNRNPFRNFDVALCSDGRGRGASFNAAST